jgi:hypothetical protein
MDALDTWHEFNVAMLGATAALAGLVIVAASVNITVIIAAPALTSRSHPRSRGSSSRSVCAVGLILALTAPAFGIAVVVEPRRGGVRGGRDRPHLPEPAPGESPARGEVRCLVPRPGAHLVGGILLSPAIPQARLDRASARSQRSWRHCSSRGSWLVEVLR